MQWEMKERMEWKVEGEVKPIGIWDLCFDQEKSWFICRKDLTTADEPLTIMNSHMH